MKLLHQIFSEDTLLRWIVAIGVFIAVTVILRLLFSLVRRRLVRLAKLTKTHWDDIAVDVLGQTKLLFLLIAGFYAGSLTLELPGRLQKFMDNLLKHPLIFRPVKKEQTMCDAHGGSRQMPA